MNVHFHNSINVTKKIVIELGSENSQRYICEISQIEGSCRKYSSGYTHVFDLQINQFTLCTFLWIGKELGIWMRALRG